jgi:DNA-binding HxlR family transcriptional regulator
MTKRKVSSSNYENELVINQCPVTFTLSLIGGRWKPLILWQLSNGTMRYNEIKKAIPNVSEKMLIEKLKELERDQLIIRKAKPIVPPYVEYELSELGKSLSTILGSMASWGLSEMKKVVKR